MPRPCHLLARMVAVAALVAALTAAACHPRDAPQRTHLRYSGSAVGAEGEVLTRQIARFERLHPELAVEVAPTPDSADQRHQLYVQWLNAGAPSPDVLQLDVVWTAELAAAGWILPVPGDAARADDAGFFAQVIAANRWQGRIYAVPLFVDVGMLYFRTDLVDHAPTSFDELVAMARRATADGRVRHGLVFQGARYEGLVTGFLEVLAGFGGAILDDQGQVVVDSPAAVRALAFMRAALDDGIVPRAVLGWQEEQTRFAFQNGEAAFMRNWPYAYPLMQNPAESRVAGKFAVAPMPAGPGGRSAAALGGAQLAVNARSRHPDAAWLLVDYLTQPEQLVERARIAGQYPARPALYRSGALAGVLPIPVADALRIIEQATPRPVTPVYSQLSAELQVQLHRALSGQASAHDALAAAAGEMKATLAATRGPARPASTAARVAFVSVLAVLLAALARLAWRRWRRQVGERTPEEERLGWLLSAPALAIVLVFAILPLAWDVWESFHAHDLRLPAQGRPFVGLTHYVSIGRSARFWAALGHTGVFMVVSVALEVVFGLTLALALHRLRRGRGALRTVSLLPWAIPTVVGGLVWRFMFADDGMVNAALVGTGVVHQGIGWLVDATLAWVPLILADVWKTTPFVAILFLAGLQGIDETLYDAARIDGASRWQQLVQITLPLLRPTLLVVLLFRSLDAFRILELAYVLTGGGPGNATEPVSLLAFGSLMRDLQFGYGAALSVVIFLIAAGLGLVYVRLLRADAGEEAR